MAKSVTSASVGASNASNKCRGTGFEHIAVERVHEILLRETGIKIVGRNDDKLTRIVEVNFGYIVDSSSIKSLLGKLYNDHRNGMDDINELLACDKISKSDVETHCIFSGQTDYDIEVDYQVYLNGGISIDRTRNDTHLHWVFPQSSNKDKWEWLKLNGNDDINDDKKVSDVASNNEDEKVSESCASDATHYVVMECTKVKSESAKKGLVLKLMQLDKKIASFAVRYFISSNIECKKEEFNEKMKECVKKSVGLCGIIWNQSYNETFYPLFKDCLELLPFLSFYCRESPFLFVNYPCIESMVSDELLANVGDMASQSERSENKVKRLERRVNQLEREKEQLKEEIKNVTRENRKLMEQSVNTTNDSQSQIERLTKSEKLFKHKASVSESLFRAQHNEMAKLRSDNQSLMKKLENSQTNMIQMRQSLTTKLYNSQVNVIQVQQLMIEMQRETRNITEKYETQLKENQARIQKYEAKINDYEAEKKEYEKEKMNEKMDKKMDIKMDEKMDENVDATWDTKAAQSLSSMNLSWQDGCALLCLFLFLYFSHWATEYCKSKGFI